MNHKKTPFPVQLWCNRAETGEKSPPGTGNKQNGQYGKPNPDHRGQADS